jgi:hypothetical protein
VTAQAGFVPVPIPISQATPTDLRLKKLSPMVRGQERDDTVRAGLDTLAARHASETRSAVVQVHPVEMAGHARLIGAAGTRRAADIVRTPAQYRHARPCRFWQASTQTLHQYICPDPELRLSQGQPRYAMTMKMTNDKIDVSPEPICHLLIVHC